MIDKDKESAYVRGRDAFQHARVPSVPLLYARVEYTFTTDVAAREFSQAVNAVFGPSPDGIPFAAVPPAYIKGMEKALIDIARFPRGGVVEPGPTLDRDTMIGYARVAIPPHLWKRGVLDAPVADPAPVSPSGLMYLMGAVEDGAKARDEGLPCTEAPGSLREALHAVGWVRRDLEHALAVSRGQTDRALAQIEKLEAEATEAAAHAEDRTRLIKDQGELLGKMSAEIRALKERNPTPPALSIVERAILRQAGGDETDFVASVGEVRRAIHRLRDLALIDTDSPYAPTITDWGAKVLAATVATEERRERIAKAAYEGYCAGKYQWPDAPSSSKEKFMSMVDAILEAL